MGPQDRVADKGVMPEINPGAQPCEIGTDGQPIRQPARSRKPQVGGLGRLCQRSSAFRLAAKKAATLAKPSEPRLDAAIAGAHCHVAHLYDPHYGPWLRQLLKVLLMTFGLNSIQLMLKARKRSNYQRLTTNPDYPLGLLMLGHHPHRPLPRRRRRRQG